MQIALRRRLRQPLPLHSNTCGPPHGCGGAVDRFGDHALACPRAGLLARRAKMVRVARESDGVGRASCSAAVVGPPPLPPHVGTQDRRSLDLVVYGALSSGGAQCCDSHAQRPWTAPCCAWPSAASVPPTQNSRGEGRRRWLCSAPRWGAAGTPRPAASCETWCVSGHTAPLQPCAPATAGWARRWWSMPSIAVQQAVASTGSGRPAACEGPPLDSILHHAALEGHSRLPLRP